MPHAGLKRGGARNRKDRVSWQLAEADCRKVIDRSFDALGAGMPLNRFVTLAWGKAAIDAALSVESTGQFISLAREWLRAHGYKMPWVWVQEHGDVFGQHAHILLHVPPDLDELFRPMPMRWAKAITGQGYASGTVQSQRVQGAKAADWNPEPYRAALLGKLHYMLKCAPKALERPLEMEGWGHKKWGQSSRVIGKRAGVWQRRDWER